MSESGERHSRLVEPALPAPTFTREAVVKREAENGLRQADRMFEMIDHAVSAGKLRVRSSTLIELNRLAAPPPCEDVPGYVDDLCDYVATNWDASYATHLAAYVLWRLNWIHPFEDGNGRTARAASYLVLSVKLGYKLPGSQTIPEFIAKDKQPYYNALESADASWKKGALDLREMEDLLKGCLAAQLVDVVEQASSRVVAVGGEAVKRSGFLTARAQRKPKLFRATLSLGSLLGRQRRVCLWPRHSRLVSSTTLR